MRPSLQSLPSILALCIALPGALPARAVEVKTAFGSFAAPDGVSAVNREEKPDKAGKPTGMAVYSRTDDPKAVFIVVWGHAEPDPAKPYDALDGAVKFGNPFDKKLTRDAARPVSLGGVEGGRYEGKLPNGLRSISYVAVNSGYRLIVLLKGPNDSPYRETMDAFAKGVEGFTWTLPAPAASAPQQ
ncbi:hypothetical protein J2X20_005154 [Pelomonas saccharophila]|uniref:Uncharacterized protein n=1 Tax=Roseateles saccharophilus TaxID=304 RepID=A0ABU1YWQ8_ROSSA|nr:hypothetical protein [Roseateles saccharophilus]MDR7272471.1 hypothetical protein [Roseateles saccharophilus]